MKPVPFLRGKVAPSESALSEIDAAAQEPLRVVPQEEAVAEARLAADSARAPVVEVDPLHLERERILPPGAAGGHGAPYKMLRTQVLRRLDKLGANSLAVVGTTTDTGKTLTAINLAIAIAADPERNALLIDLDLRKPSIHLRLGLEPQAGIDDCLRSKRPPGAAMLRVGGYERLVVMPARERTLDSSELLSTRRTEEMMVEMRGRYKDRVLVFDLPPVLEADDALAFVRHAQAALIVVAEGRTRRDDVLRTIELLQDLPIIGTVLNGTRERVVSYY